jgi:hypothetical protein
MSDIRLPVLPRPGPDISGGLMWLTNLYGLSVLLDTREVVIEHREIPGAIMRIPRYMLTPRDRLWPPGVEPWMDGSGHPIPGRSPR